MRIQVSLENVGVAPIYRPYRFAFRFRQDQREEVIQSRRDIRKWLPGHVWFQETLTFPKWLKRGRSTKLDVGIVDPDTGEPRVRFAIEDVRKDGWHPMTLVDVV